MTKLSEAEKNNDNAKDLANALKGILKNRGRKADSIASYDILDALENAGLKLVSTIDDSLARLTTAEAERDRAQWAAADLAKQRDSLRSQAVAAHRAAEARVEALSIKCDAAVASRERWKARVEAAEKELLVYYEWRAIADRHPGFLARDSRTMAEKAVAARAALACPPQQRSEK